MLVYRVRRDRAQRGVVGDQNMFKGRRFVQICSNHFFVVRWLRGIYNTDLYNIEMRSGHLESKKHNQEDNEFSDPYCEDSEYTVP